jgi:hypothetical protein
METEITDVKELPLEFKGIGEVRGFKFLLIGKNEKGYMYQVEDDGKRHFEVFKRKINQFGGVSYPKAKSFGIWAWSTSDFSKAQEYFRKL